MVTQRFEGSRATECVARHLAAIRDLFTLYQVTLPRVLAKSKLAEAFPYAISCRNAFELFLKGGRTEVDSNVVGRAIRRSDRGRSQEKNSLFAGSDGGAKTSAKIAKLLQTAKV